jgi:hypothetical protein
MKDLFNFREISKITGACLFIYFLSFLGYIFPFLNYLLFVVIFITALSFTLKKLEYGILILLTELAMGVKGYLFSFNIGSFIISLRLALFIMVFLVWFFKKREGKFKFIDSKFFPLYSLFTVSILVGIVIGLINGNFLKNIFFDVNGYFYLALAFVLFNTIKNKEKAIRALRFVIAGGLAVSILTLYTFAEFTIFHQESRPDMAEAISYEQSIEEEEVEGTKISHSITAKKELSDLSILRNFENEKPPIYRWITDTSIGEISYLAGSFF